MERRTGRTADARDVGRDEHLLTQRAGAQLVDRKVTFACLVDAGTPPATKDAGRFEIHQTTTYTAQLEALAWQSGEFSRFQRDGTFAPTVFVDLYSHWLRASLTGELARAVFCATLAGQESGLLTLEDHGEYASIGLLAAGAAWRGQGIGKALIGQALREAELWGCAQVRVATQRENVPACRFYARCGFDVVREEHVYHLWL